MPAHLQIRSSHRDCGSGASLTCRAGRYFARMVRMDAVLVDSRDACEVFFTRAADHPVETRAVGLPDQTEPHLGHGQDRSRRVIARAMMSPALAAFFRAAAFLTRLPPVARAFEGGPHPLGKDVLAFPLVGLLAALPAAFLLAFLPEAGLSALVAAALAVAATILVTGALHEDGLGDVADGLFGHHGRERALAIMKDSRVGSYGALALILIVALRIALLAELLSLGSTAAALATLGAAAFSRGAMTLLWASLPSADPGGLADSVGQPPLAAGWRALWLGAAIFFLLSSLGIGLSHAVLSLSAGAAMLFAFRHWLRDRLGGQTGDTLGAAQQLTEIAALFALCLR